MSSINGNYSKELAKSRENFNNAVQKIKENYDKNIHDVEANNARREEQSSKVNESRREKLIDANHDQLVNLSNKTDTILEQKQKEFLQGLKTERDQSDSGLKKAREDFQDKLGSIKESYLKTAEQMKDSHDRQDRDNEQKYFTGIQTTKFNTDKKIQEMQKNTENTIHNANTDAAAQKKELTHRNQQNLEEVKRDSHAELDKKTEYSLKKMQELTRNKDAELNNLNEKYDFNMGKSKAEDKELFDNTLNRYEDHTKDLLRSFQTKYNRLEDNANQKMQIEKGHHDKELYNSEREKALFVDRNFKGEGAEGEKAVIKDHYEHRLGNLKKNLAEQADKFQRESSELNSDSKFEMKARDLENQKKADKRDDHFRKEISNIEKRSRSSEDSLSGLFRDKLHEQEDTDGKKINFERDVGRQKLDNQKRAFGKSVNKLSEMNINNIQKLQDENSIEKANLIENAKREIHQTVAEVRDSYRQKYDKTVESYDKKLLGQESLVEKIKDEAEGRIENISRNTQKQIDSEASYNLEARTSDRKIMQDNFAELKRDYDQKYRSSKDQFDQELNHVKKLNDVMVTRLSRKNEDEKASLLTEHNKELKRVTTELRDDLSRFSKSAKIEKENLIETYERRIQDLKSSYDIEKLRYSENKKTDLNSTKA
jgi:hypothetical protein